MCVAKFGWDGSEVCGRQKTWAQTLIIEETCQGRMPVDFSPPPLPISPERRELEKASNEG